MSKGRERRGPAVRAAEAWLTELAGRGVLVDPVLRSALRDAARACDRARDTDTEGGRLAYVARELRAARTDVAALDDSGGQPDPWEAFSDDVSADCSPPSADLGSPSTTTGLTPGRSPRPARSCG